MNWTYYSTKLTELIFSQRSWSGPFALSAEPYRNSFDAAVLTYATDPSESSYDLGFPSRNDVRVFDRGALDPRNGYTHQQ